MKCMGVAQFCIGKAENPAEGFTLNMPRPQLQIETAYGHKVSVHEPV